MTNRARLLATLTATTAALVLLAGCASTPASETKAVDDAALLGTWVIDETFDSPEQPYIDFADDGTWSASDGCNRVQGTWDLGDNGALTTTAGPSTLMACDGAQLPLAVSLADSVSITDDKLTIYSSHDSTTTVLVRSTDSTVGPQGLPIGQWVGSGEDAPFLSIAADGRYSGSDGCNNIMGDWTAADDGAITFSSGATTLMACEAVDTWLGQAALGRVQAGVMTIQDASGTVLGQLSAQ